MTLLHPVLRCLLPLLSLIALSLSASLSAFAADPSAPSGCGASPGGAPCGGSGPASQGNASATNQGAGNPINVITGNKYQQEVDLPALPGVLGLEIVRHYNSTYADAKAPAGLLGRGWKLSYETDLYTIGNTLQIVQADGTRIIFIRDPRNPSQCATNDPARGSVSIQKTPHGEEYTWTWPNGRSLVFNQQGKLTQIKAPSGEFVSLARDTAGVLVKVTDPQGRSLVLGYPSRASARTQTHFNGVQFIDSPVGRFAYAYGSAAPKGATGNPRDLLASLTAVSFPNAVSRRYHYEDPAHPTLLTGISVAGQGGQLQRITTWAYDDQGRGILSVKGRPRQIGQDGKPVPGTGIEQVKLDFSIAGQTTLTNSLGQKTVYTHAIVGGEYRLLDVRGAGCASCGEANIQYGYDKFGRLTEETRLSLAGKPIQTTRTERDGQGRAVSVSTLVYSNGRAQPARLQVRYAYAPLDTRNPQDSDPVADQPILIARPSVIPGQEQQIHLTYNPAGQPLRVTETGWTPGQGGAPPGALTRSTTYSYTRLNGRSLLTQIDGPLKNGLTNSPVDSDITLIQYDGRGSFITQITYPMNRSVSLAHDEAGRTSAVTGVDGVITQTSYNPLGAVVATRRYPASLGLQAAQDTGLLLVTSTLQDALGRTTQITRADGQSLKLSYGINGQLSQLSDNLGNRVEWKDWNKGQENGEGQVTTQQWFTADAPTHIARAWYFWHDSQDRLTQRLSPDGGLDQWAYPYNSKTGPDNRAGPPAGWTTHTDPLGRLTAMAQNVHGTAQVRMTPDGEIDANLPTVDDTGTTLQTLDDFGRVVQFASPQHGTATAQYNAAGQIIRILQPDGTRIDYTLDAAGRPIQKTATRANTTATIRFRYTAQGLSQVEDSAQTTAYAYDLLGRQIEKRITLKLMQNAQQGYTIRTRYDAHGQVKARQLADGNWLVFTPNHKTGLTQTIKLHHPILPALTQTLARWFNAPDLPLMLATRKTVVTDIQVSPLDGITRYVNGNGTVTDYRFDLAGRLTGIEQGTEQGKASGSIFKASYHYDAGQRLSSETLNQIETKYAYQGWERLAQPTPVQPATQFQYDAAGRTIQDERYRYHYDVWGKLHTVTEARANNKVIATYAYNAYGERVKANYASGSIHVTRYYLYDQQKRVAELDANGKLIQQYFYLNDKPIAVLDSNSSDTELIALHTDRRGAPVAASNAQGKVIWRASYSAWGSAKIQTVATKEAANEPVFTLALRLPGQWEDRATYLYYNYQRDYNPKTGRYLTPDPLGFPDGPDATLYVGGDPVNRVDQLGLYEIDVHYYMTYFLARMAGLSAPEAYTVALGDQYIDENPATWPLDPNNLSNNPFNAAAINRLASYHFTQAGYDPSRTTAESLYYLAFGVDMSSYQQRRILNPNNPQLQRLLGASTRAPSRCAQLQFFGEYLHAFEDAFGHRNKDNEPINVNQGFGHFIYGHNPDKTYNHWVLASYWGNNESRTLEMEKEVFNKVRSTWGTTGKNQLTSNVITFTTIQSFLKTWNTIQDGNQKIVELNFKLAEFGFETIPPYNTNCAQAKRNEYVGGLNPSTYPGVILPAQQGAAGSAQQACGGST